MTGDKDKNINEEDVTNEEDTRGVSDNNVEGESADAEVPERADPIDQAVEEQADVGGEEEALAEQAEASQVASTEAGEREAQPAKSRSGLAWFALLLAIIACGISGYIAWQQYLGTQMQTSGLADNAAQIASLGGALTQQEKNLASLDGRISQASAKSEERVANANAKVVMLENALAETQQRLDSHSRRLLSLTATTTDDWRIAEVDYLVRLANQRILISRDSVTADNLLAAADNILLELGDPRLFKVRKAIAEDRAALNVVGAIDTDGIFLTLAAITQQIDQLPIISSPVFERELVKLENEESKSENEQKGRWYDSVVGAFSVGWKEVQSWLVINKQDAAIKPLLPPEQQYYLRGNLKILLNQAQLALLESRPEPYQSSLATAVDWIERQFPMDEVVNQRVVAQLKSLGEINISPEYPDLSQSLLTIKSFINSQHAQVEEVVKKASSAKNAGESKSAKAEESVPDSESEDAQ